MKHQRLNVIDYVISSSEYLGSKLYDVYENFTRADDKARVYLINLKFPAKHAGCHFSLISDVTPSIPIYLFNCIKAIV
jgi:hypothetical protein